MTLLLGLVLMVTSCGKMPWEPRESQDEVTELPVINEGPLTADDATIQYLNELDSITIQTVYYDMPALCIYAIYDLLGATASRKDIYKEYILNQTKYDVMEYGALLYRQMCEKGYDPDNIIKLNGYNKKE